MKISVNYMKSYIFYICSAFGISVGIIANIGVASYNSMNLSISHASAIKVGTVISILNTIFLITYMILTKFKYKHKYLIQFISVFMFGLLINFFTYNVLHTIINLSYAERILLFCAGNIFSGLSCGMIVFYNLITFPLESFCLRVSELTRFSFVIVRYSLDIIFALTSLVVSYMFNLPVYIREGTIISLVLFSFCVNLSKNFAEKRLAKKITLQKD